MVLLSFSIVGCLSHLYAVQLLCGKRLNTTSSYFYSSILSILSVFMRYLWWLVDYSVWITSVRIGISSPWQTSSPYLQFITPTKGDAHLGAMWLNPY
ncbi:hypothetical protein J3F84DRAFT_369524 [Trichoderma pleuroticola]